MIRSTINLLVVREFKSMGLQLERAYLTKVTDSIKLTLLAYGE